MMERKFTDDEIVKSMKCCSTPYTSDCRGCHYQRSELEDILRDGCATELMRDAIDLINSKNAEIDRLEVELKAMRGAANSYKAEVERLQKEVGHNYAIRDEACKMLEDLEKSIPIQFAKAKFEAIKEFAERLKDKASGIRVGGHEFVTVEGIDNLIKEMTVEDNGN